MGFFLYRSISLFRRRQYILIEYLMNSASFWRHVFSSNYEQLLMYFFLHTRSHTLEHSRQVCFSSSFFLSHQSRNYLTRKTVTISRWEEETFLNVLWEKKRIYPFRENVLSDMCNSMHCAIFSYFYWKKDKTHIFFFVGWYLKNVFRLVFVEGERSRVPQGLETWKQ